MRRIFCVACVIVVLLPTDAVVLLLVFSYSMWNAFSASLIELIALHS